MQPQPSQQQQQQEAGGTQNVPEEDAPVSAYIGGRRNVRKVSKMEQYSTDKGAAKEFFKKEPCIHTHRMFERAAKIFQGLKLAKQRQQEKKDMKQAGGPGAKIKEEENDEPTIPHMDFKGPTEKKLTFELAFSSLKCEYDHVHSDAVFVCLSGLGVCLGPSGLIFMWWGCCG